MAAKKHLLVAKWDPDEKVLRPQFKDLASRLLSGYRESNMYLIEVKPYRERRTIQQNRLYWGVLMPIILDFHEENTGEKVEPQEMHIYICTHVMGMKPRVVEVFGSQYLEMQRARTSKMSKQEFSQFIEVVINFFQEKGCDFTDFYEYKDRA